MVLYTCNICLKNFDKKSNYQVHIARKNKCENIIYHNKKNDDTNEEKVPAQNPHKTAQKLKKTAQNPHKTAQNFEQYKINEINNYKCSYCNKTFVRKDSIKRHINKYCLKAKEHEIKKEELFQNLMKEMIVLKKQNEFLHEEVMKIKNNNINLQNINSNNNNSNNNNNYNINNGIIDNHQNIVLVGYNNEDFNKINIKDFIKLLRRGFQAPIELTKAIHFNPLLPEYHNIYIPKMNEKYALCYDGYDWKVVDKDELAENIYEHKRAHIIEKWEDFADQLTDTQIKALNRWFICKDDKDIKILKDDIKKVLYEKRHLVIQSKKKIEKQNKEIQ
jgi:hypothetical protein